MVAGAAVATVVTEICTVASVAGTAVATEHIGTATSALIMVASVACEPTVAVVHTVAAGIALENVVTVPSIMVVRVPHGANRGSNMHKGRCHSSHSKVTSSLIQMQQH